MLQSKAARLLNFKKSLFIEEIRGEILWLATARFL